MRKGTPDINDLITQDFDLKIPRGRRKLHKSGAHKAKAWRQKQFRRIEAWVNEEASDHLEALRFSYPALSISEIVVRILCERHSRKDFSLIDPYY
jgi:hypothetical protein